MLGLERVASVKDKEALFLLVQSGRYLGILGDHVIHGIESQSHFRPHLTDEASYVDHSPRKRHPPDRKAETFVDSLIKARNS